MFELNLKYETSQQTDIEQSVLMDNIFNYIKKEYQILERTDHKIVVTFNTGSGLLWMSRSKQTRTIKDGRFDVGEAKITFTYYLDILPDIIFISIGILLGVFADSRAFMLPILPTVMLIFRIRALRTSSRDILWGITSNSTQPITTKFKSIRFDREKV
ncbi:hypothetical protein [Mucilaginibacter polytrichastri]|uniref:Uncharacterized protein n=1 Tax=Mucilaginibacter polytrichastri TaxID=1302689 RepID=A0A1Q5ZV50_9SPHI|nr:hypothetical protein [Mucilaginibacter polytrichastri]OKS85640.1 hypothetical protein RG47T_1086 [Mucilaginibacter polytrichastri]SFS35206.1 hypothetical protein SAMN04487890_10118 [Mucilaginibacter polytrichastri]